MRCAPESMLDRPSADRTAELLFWYAEAFALSRRGHRRDAPRLDRGILKLALGRPVQFAHATWDDPAKDIAASRLRVRSATVLSPGPDPLSGAGAEPGAPLERSRNPSAADAARPSGSPKREQRWPDACAAQANWAYSVLRDQNRGGHSRGVRRADRARARDQSRSDRARRRRCLWSGGRGSRITSPSPRCPSG